jgi:hypothetical protein
MNEEIILALCKLVMKLIFHTRLDYYDIEPEMRLLEDIVYKEKHK